MEKKPTHIAVVPSPWLSNLVACLEFSKRLLHHHPHFHVSFIVPILESLPKAFESCLHSLPPNLHIIFLPPIFKHELPPQQGKQVVHVKLAVTKSLPRLHETLKSLPPLAAVVADLFAAEVLQFSKKELNALSFILFTGSATALSVFFQIPKLHDEISGEFKDHPEIIQIPGCPPIHGIDLPDPIQNRSSPSYQQFLQMTKSFYFADGILVNSFKELEEEAVKAFSEEYGRDKPPVYLVGPLTRESSNEKTEQHEETEDCVTWLNKQPPKSVLYISFGGAGIISQQQINELASSLELSGKKFLWVVRPPPNHETEDPLFFLPQGFLERTKDQGLVVPLWAPQIKILNHGSVGGFVCHCGWNSIIESVQFGVPIIAWPLFAEQRLNAVWLTKSVKVALWPKRNEDGIVEKEEIVKVVNGLMEEEEGREIRERIEKLKENAEKAVKLDGSTTKTLSELALKWENYSGK